MGNTASKMVVVFLVIAAVTVALFFFYNRQSGPKKVSRFGEYRGYSEAIYDGYVRRSDYLTLSDGTKLAYDVLLPAKDRVPADEPLPVLDSAPEIRLLRNATYASFVEIPIIPGR